jgi:hypothetical protein
MWHWDFLDSGGCYQTITILDVSLRDITAITFSSSWAWLHWLSRRRSYFTTDGQSVCLGVGHPFGAYDQILLFPLFCRKIALFFVLERPLWREDGSIICSAICQWLESRRTHNHTLLCHLRLLGSLSVASYDSQGLRWKDSYPPPHGDVCLIMNVNTMVMYFRPSEWFLQSDLLYRAQTAVYENKPIFISVSENQNKCCIVPWLFFHFALTFVPISMLIYNHIKEFHKEKTCGYLPWNLQHVTEIDIEATGRFSQSTISLKSGVVMCMS